MKERVEKSDPRVETRRRNISSRLHERLDGLSNNGRMAIAIAICLIIIAGIVIQVINLF